MTINALYERALDGDEHAKSQLFEQLSARLELFACHRIQNVEDSREITQDAMVKIAQMFNDIQIEKSFSAWSYQILKNEIRNFIRKKSVRSKVMESSWSEEDSRGSFNPDPVFESRLLECLRAITRVNKRYARILNLSYQGYESQQMCERLKVNKTNLYSILSRSRKMLRECLDKESQNL